MLMNYNICGQCQVIAYWCRKKASLSDSMVCLSKGKVFFGKKLFGKQQLGNMFLGNMLFGKMLLPKS